MAGGIMVPAPLVGEEASYVFYSGPRDAFEVTGLASAYLEEAVTEIGARAYPGALSTATMMGATAAHITEASRDAGVDAALPEAVKSHYDRAIAAGHGADNWTSLWEVIAKHPSAGGQQPLLAVRSRGPRARLVGVERSARGTDETVTREVDSGIAELVPDLEVPDAWTLCLNGTPQSHVDLEDPTRFEFDYVRRLAHVVDLVAPAGAPLRVMHLGAGALTLPRYIATTRPRSPQQAVEIDAALIELVRAWLPLDDTWPVRIRHGDARTELAKASEGAFDLVVTDVFAGARTPAHLTSVEYVSLAGRALSPAGVYAANIADGGQLAFARAQVATARAVFPHVCVVAEPTVFRGRRFGNFVLVASRTELPLPALARRVAGDPFPGRVEHGEALTRFTGSTRPTTDETATRSPQPPVGTFGLTA